MFILKLIHVSIILFLIALSNHVDASVPRVAIPGEFTSPVTGTSTQHPPQNIHVVYHIGYDCPACSMMGTSIEDTLAQFGDSVTLEVRHVTHSPLHLRLSHVNHYLINNNYHHIHQDMYDFVDRDFHKILSDVTLIDTFLISRGVDIEHFREYLFASDYVHQLLSRQYLAEQNPIIPSVHIDGHHTITPLSSGSLNHMPKDLALYIQSKLY